MKKVTEINKKRISKIRQLMSKACAPHRGKPKQEVIDDIRKIREKLWEEKLTGHS